MVYAITCTCGRHTILERSVRFFLDQNYPEKHTLLIYNNSDVSQKLADFQISENKTIILINNAIDKQTNERYTSVGAIFRDALTYIPLEEDDVINHFDDDDIFLPNHITEGVKGITKAITYNKLAYKSWWSYYRDSVGIHKVHNTIEPSIFVLGKALLQYGYRQTVVDYHQGWLDELLKTNKILIDGEGIPTTIYNWGDVNIQTFKISGGSNDMGNFINHKRYSKDNGDRIITPIGKNEAIFYYNLVNKENV